MSFSFPDYPEEGLGPIAGQESLARQHLTWTGKILGTLAAFTTVANIVVAELFMEAAEQRGSYDLVTLSMGLPNFAIAVGTAVVVGCEVLNNQVVTE